MRKPIQSTRTRRRTMARVKEWAMELEAEEMAEKYPVGEFLLDIPSYEGDSDDMKTDEDCPF